MKKIYIALFAFLCLMLTTCEKYPMIQALSYELNDVEIKGTSICISGEYTYGEAMESIFVYCSKTNDFNAYFKVEEATLDENRFVATFSELEPETQYYFCMEFFNGINSLRSDATLLKTGKNDTPDKPDTPEEPVEIKVPTVTTNNITDIHANFATCGGNVTSDGGATVTERGVCWSTSQNPTVNDNKTNNGSGTDSYTSELSNLASQTTYYVRAYAVNKAGVSYGDEKIFTTTSEIGAINGHDWVDLGLPSGLKWATCNVGANEPEAYGEYYAWGETSTKTTYTEDNCTTYGKQMGDISGNAQYDVARKKWGSTWRIPTKAEQQELLDNCTWEWTTQNGVNGYKVTGTNGNHIFLPAAGYRSGSSLYGAGEYGYYWSSTPYGSYTIYAYFLSFNSGNPDVSWDSRDDGQSVRPVSE